jgi:magnesium-transporting ATPase (P-type)
MNKIKQTALQLPEYLLIAAVVFYWISSAVVFNPLAIILIAVLVLQIIFKNRIVGLVIPGLLIMACFYMLLALMSEFNEFPTFNADARKLLVVGLSFFLSTIAVSVLMIYKYASPKPTS